MIVIVHGLEGSCDSNYVRGIADKAWARHERRSALTKALHLRREYILPIRFDDTILPGLDPDIGYLRVGTRSPEDIADLIADLDQALSVLN